MAIFTVGGAQTYNTNSLIGYNYNNSSGVWVNFQQVPGGLAETIGPVPGGGGGKYVYDVTGLVYANGHMTAGTITGYHYSATYLDKPGDPNSAKSYKFDITGLSVDAAAFDTFAYANWTNTTWGDNNTYLDLAAGNDTMYGSAGADTIQGGAGDDVIWGGDGNDLIFGDAGANSIVGGNGDDTLVGSNFTLTGATGWSYQIGRAHV